MYLGQGCLIDPLPISAARFAEELSQLRKVHII